MFDGEAFGEMLAKKFKAHVDRELAPLRAENKALCERLAAVEALSPIRGEDGQPGRDGKDFDPAVLESMLAANLPEAIAKAVDALPKAQDGQDGAPGRDGADAVLPDIAAMIDERIAALPRPKDGAPGRDGKDADPVEVERLIAEAVAKIPAPVDGKDGAPGVDAALPDIAAMVDERVAKAVADIPIPRDGVDGKDGVGLAGAMIDRSGQLVVTFTNGQTKDLGLVVGRDGSDGVGMPGRDAFSLEDFDAEVKDGGRTLVLSLAAGDIRHIVELALDIPIDRGVFKEGAEYQKGDGVTWGGSWFIAQKDTTAKPETNGDWRLAVKRGRDGRDAVKAVAQ